MERGRSPLVSIARASAGKRRQRTEPATGFKRRSAWATVGTFGAPDTVIVALRPGGGLGLTAEGPYSKRKANWLGKEESTERGVLQRDDAPGIGADQMASRRVARGARLPMAGQNRGECGKAIESRNDVNWNRRDVHPERAFHQRRRP